MILSVAKQISLSVAGTLAATVLMTSVHPRLPSLQPALTQTADLTSGGKFAARAEAGNVNEDAFVTLTVLPAILPLFTAPALRQLDMALQTEDVPLSTAPRISAIALEVSKHAPSLARIEAKRRIGPEAGILPPRRVDFIPTGLETSSEPMADEDGIWSASKRLAHRVVVMSGVVLDILTP